MPGDPMLYRLPAWAIAGLLALAIMLVLFVSSAIGQRAERTGRNVQLGPLETMASGLLGLLLAFNFNIAQNRFDARQRVLIREADAIGTTYLRCSVLDEDERRLCREHLRRYTTLRVAAYEAFGRSDPRPLVGALSDGEKVQNALWTLVARATRANPSPANALLMSALNDVIDLDTDRRAALRIMVPQAVSVVIVFACLAWAALLGYSSGVRRSRSRPAWAVVALLIAVVFGVALDFDRPRSGFITTSAAEHAMKNLVRTMENTPAD